MTLSAKIKDRFDKRKQEVLSIDTYLDIISKDPSAYANPAERMLKAIGEPEILDTRSDPRLSRIFSNKTIKVYKAFHDFYGLESTIEEIISYFRHSAQNLEEKKQVLYLLGAVGSAKSSLAERLKQLMEQEPIYVLSVKNADGSVTKSPVFESPLGLFKKQDASDLNVPERVLNERLSPWAIKRLSEFDGDITKFVVVKIHPSQADQIAISKTEPGDENNQDISALVGKIDIRKLAKFSQNDPDAYSYSGGLCLSNQGLLEFVEMFKAPIKVLHPLLTATQEGNYNGTEAISSIPFEGIIIAHSNESEWTAFRNNKNNEAFIDRIYIVKVHYSLRESEEEKIYKKLIANSALAKAPVAPQTLSLLARFAVLSRLKPVANSELFTKLKVYNGENMKEKDPKAKTLEEYRENAGVDEGMSGISTRFAFKVLSKTFNFDGNEVAANPVHLFHVLTQQIKQEQFSKEIEDKYISYINTYLEERYLEFLEKEIQMSYLDSHDEYGQNLFDRYVAYADYWIQDNDYRDADTGELWDRAMLNTELEELEKPAGIVNPKDFRQEVVNFVLRAKANNNGKCDWKSYAKLKTVIQSNMFSKIQDLLPVISFNAKDSKSNQEKHQDFVVRMMKMGYTEKQVRLLVEWFNRKRKSK